MDWHLLKIRPVALFGKLAAILLLLASCRPGPNPVREEGPPPPGISPAPAQDPTAGGVAGRATIQLRNASFRSDLAGMDLVLAPVQLLPEIRRVRMETWRTDGLAVNRTSDGAENPVGVRIDFSDGYKNLDLVALGQAAANAALYRTKTATNGEFLFPNLPPGNYALYGQYKSRYAVAYWLQEVPVARGQIHRLELTETNAAEVFNRFEGPAR